MKYGLSWMTSRSIEWLLIPTVAVTGRFAFEVFAVNLRWLRWGIGFYVYRGVPR